VTNFGNDGRFQFTYAGLANNAIIFDFTPYTTLGCLATWTPNKKNSVLFLISDADGRPDKSGFDTVFNGNTVYCIQYTFSPTINKKLPGNYRIIYAHSTKPITNYRLEDKNIIPINIKKIFIQKKCNNYSLLVNFDQYLKVNSNNDKIAQRHNKPPVGILLFGRAGWTPKDRNTIDQFYSIGIGSYGGFRKRYYDLWGIGYAATHISWTFRKELKKHKILFNNFEHAFEAFYNAQLTPALHFTVNTQIIRPPQTSRGVALVINSRLQIDF